MIGVLKCQTHHIQTVTNKAEKTRMQRISIAINAQYATINFQMRQIKTIFVANNTTNEQLHTSKRQLAKFYLGK